MVVEDGRWKNWKYEPWMREAAGISALHSHPILLSRAFFRVLFFASTQNSAKKRDRESTLNQTLYTKHSYLNHFSPFEFVFQSSHFNNFQSLKFREREIFWKWLTSLRVRRQVSPVIFRRYRRTAVSFFSTTSLGTSSRSRQSTALLLCRSVAAHTELSGTSSDSFSSSSFCSHGLVWLDLWWLILILIFKFFEPWSSVLNSETNEMVGMKKIANAFDNHMDAKRTLREIKLLRHFDHENVS